MREDRAMPVIVGGKKKEIAVGDLRGFGPFGIIKYL